MTMKLTWYGHAALGLETDGYKLVVDPFFTGNPAASISPEAVEADFILVSHGHGDHVGDGVAMPNGPVQRSSVSTKLPSGLAIRDSSHMVSISAADINIRLDI